MYTNINTINRVSRIVLSLGIVYAVLSMSGPLGALVYAPFISIYAGITGFIGWDPVNELISKRRASPAANLAHVHHGELAAH